MGCARCCVSVTYAYIHCLYYSSCALLVVSDSAKALITCASEDCRVTFPVTDSDLCKVADVNTVLSGRLLLPVVCLPVSFVRTVCVPTMHCVVNWTRQLCGYQSDHQMPFRKNTTSACRMSASFFSECLRTKYTGRIIVSVRYRFFICDI